MWIKVNGKWECFINASREQANKLRLEGMEVFYITDMTHEDNMLLLREILAEDNL